jgi:hypothetical protein
MEKTAEDLAELRSKAEDLRQQIDTLRRALVATNAASDAPLSGLTNRLLAVRAELNRKAKEEADIQARMNDGSKADGRGVYEPAAAEMKSEDFLLSKSQVIPVKSPYFEGIRIGPDVIIHRVRDGEPVGQAIKLGGLIESITSKSDTNKHYFHFLVCPDSITALNTAIQFVRKSNFRYSWDTFEDKPVRIPADSGGNEDNNEKEIVR